MRKKVKSERRSPRLIAQQGADEKSQLEEWKADLLHIHNLTSEIAQIYKAHDNEMEAQCEQFQFEIEMLEEKI